MVCPSFVADCLETVEEIGEQGAGIFVASGGDGYNLVPCLNSRPEWTDTVIALAEKA